MDRDDSPQPAADADAACAAAVEHHRAGRFPEAEALYAQALSLDPRHVKASHNLGALLLQQKATDRALPLLAFAARADPDGPQSWITYAHALIASGAFEAAQTLLAAHADRAQDPPVRALTIRLGQAWGIALTDTGALAAALAQFEAVLAIAPQDADAHADVGFVQLKLGDAQAAEASLAQALALSPDHIAALVNRSAALKALGRAAEAEAGYRRVLALKPDDVAATRSLAILLADLGRGDEAAAAYARAVELDGGSYETLDGFGVTLWGLGRYDEALAALDAAAARRPDDPQAIFKRAPLRLLIGDFEGGWRDYEARWRTQPFIDDSSAMVTPQVRQMLRTDLTASELTGQRVLLVGEQGIGDQVMFASLIPELAATAASVICVCDRRLVTLFSSSFPGVHFFSPSEARIPVEAFDIAIALGSLGRLYRNRPTDFPGTPYLRASAAVGTRWAERLGPRPGGLRIGLSWRGGTPTTGMAERSTALAELAPVLALPDCEFVSLQYGDAGAELTAANAGSPSPIRVVPPAEIEAFEDLAGLIGALDVVVSVQTSVVHLTGALGKACLALVPPKPEWRYGAQGPSMPWYGSVRIFRRARGEDWAPAIERLTQALQSRNGALARP